MLLFLLFGLERLVRFLVVLLRWWLVVTFVCERQCGSASGAARVNTSGVREVYKKMTDPMPLREPTPVIMQTLPLRREVRGAFWR